MAVYLSEKKDFKTAFLKNRIAYNRVTSCEAQRMPSPHMRCTPLGFVFSAYLLRFTEPARLVLFPVLDQVIAITVKKSILAWS